MSYSCKIIPKKPLIAFEGIDGSGKSSQAKRVYNLLKKQNYFVSLFQEPTSGYYGKKIRLIINGKSSRPDPIDELELFLKDREDNLEKNIRPCIKKNNIVILDRYYYSTIAYQGARGIDIEYIRSKNEKIALIPNLVILLEVEIKEALKRIKLYRGNELDNYEQYNYLKKVDRIYRSLPDKAIVRVNSNEKIEIVNKKVDNIIEAAL